jgi:hypothetical protein
VRDAIGDRTGRYGSHAVRTAPVRQDKESPLQVNPLPHLIGYDIGIFELSGQFKNAGDKPLQVELATTLPEACFPEGAASRAFTAAPMAVTPFRILTVLTMQSATGAVRSVNGLPVQILDSDGHVLAKQQVKLLIDKPENRLGPSAPKPLIDSLVGGELIVRITNATARPQALTLNLPPPSGVKMSESSRNVSLAARGLVVVSGGALGIDGAAHEGALAGAQIPLDAAGLVGTVFAGSIVVELLRMWLGPRGGRSGQGEGPAPVADRGRGHQPARAR